MRKLARTLSAVGACLTLALGLAACGDSGVKTVATVGKTKVSQTTLKHWMQVVFGGDYLAALGGPAPVGLVADPVDYPKCISVARTMAPKSVSDAELHARCRGLNAAVREQALGYVLGVLWRIEEGAELGIRPSERELAERLKALIHNQYGTTAAFNKVLADNSRTLADERFLLKRNILQVKLMARFKAKAARIGGGEKTLAKLILKNNAKWTAKTSCSPGYVAWECKQYGPSYEGRSSVAVAIEGLSAG